MWCEEGWAPLTLSGARGSSWWPRRRTAPGISTTVSRHPPLTWARHAHTVACRKIEAAREIAGTISQSANRVFLSAESLLLNLVRSALRAVRCVGWEEEC